MSVPGTTEHRPYPYYNVEANLLENIKNGAAEGLFHSFDILLGKDVREAGIKFEVLLGVYTNAVEFVKFLETALAISCVNTEFKDLNKMTDGKIQFRVNMPTIANGDGRRPTKQRQYIIVKNCHRHHISTELEMSIMDLQILNSIPETELDYVEYVGAIKTVANAIQFGIDALERGLIDTVLKIKLRHAPPMFILKTLSDPTFTEMGLKKNVKSDMISMFKKSLIDHTFFLDKAEFMGSRGQQYIQTRLSEMMGSVSTESVIKGLTTYTTETGGVIDGVFVTTDNILRLLLSNIGEKDKTMIGPAAYASFVVRNENVVTAVSYGKVMRSFEHFMARIVDEPEKNTTVATDKLLIDDENSMDGRAAINASLIQIGNQIVALESLQKMYNDTQVPYPLNRRMQYTYYFPVGLFLVDPKYTTSNTVKILENPQTSVSTETWVINKNNYLQCFSYQNALRMLCHPRMFTANHVINNLYTHSVDAEPETFSVENLRPISMNLLGLIKEFYGEDENAKTTSISKKCQMGMDDLVHPNNYKLLELELHPFFDFFKKEMQMAVTSEYKASHRIMVGNIPPPLAPPNFMFCRGLQFEQNVGLHHIIDQQTMEIIQETAFDPAYPAFCYVIESMVHGFEEKFNINKDLIALVITTYWETGSKLAFVNSFHFVKYICLYFGNNLIPKDAYNLYRKIYGQLLVMEQSIIKLAGSDIVNDKSLGYLIHTLLDPCLLPPFAFYDIFSYLITSQADRKPRVLIGQERYNNVDQLAKFISVIDNLATMHANVDNMYTDRTTANHDIRTVLPLGRNTDENIRSQVLEKLFYYVLLPVCTNGHVCGIGVDYMNVASVLAYNGPVFGPNFDRDSEILDYLENGTLRQLLEAADLKPTINMIRNLCISFLTSPSITQAVRVVTNLDETQIGNHDNGTQSVEQTVLVNGFASFAFSERNKQITRSLFYAVPFHNLYGDPKVAATISGDIARFIARNPQQKTADAFSKSEYIMAEYREWHRLPMTTFVNWCKPKPECLSALLAAHIKLSPVALIAQSKFKLHPGFALTVLRTDEVLSESIMYSTRAATSMFIGVPNVMRREVRADCVKFDIDHEMASIDTGLGYSSAIAPGRVAAITTDMGIHCQDFYSIFTTDVYSNYNIHNYIKQKAGVFHESNVVRDPRTYIPTNSYITNIPGLSHGQFSTCEVIITPVTADISYFQTSNSPRGRASCVVSCENYNSDSAEKLIYDHSISDPMYEFRNTNNPWASQKSSLGDVLYNSSFRQTATPGFYSPSRAFFNKEEMLKNNRGLFTMINEYSQRISGGHTAATSNSELQFVVISGTDVFVHYPCGFLQEAFPTLSASSRALIDEFMSSKTTHAPVHYGHFLIEEVAPMRRVFNLGNKVVY